MNAQVALGAPLWRPPAPNGYPDNETAWIDGILRRIDIATEFTGRASRADLLEALESGLGPSPRHKRDRPWRGRKVAARHWRFWPWRQSFCGDDNAPACTLAP